MFSNLAQLLQSWNLSLQAGAGSYLLSRWLFLRLLGFIYLAAFLSLWMQLEGLIGPDGILPAIEYLRLAGEQLGSERYWMLPTLSWLNSSETFLHFQCATGVLFALFVVAGLVTRVALGGLWVLYLSLSTVSREFLSFQWDILLLETGFLSIFLAPRQWRPQWSQDAPPSMLIIWLLRWLLFRLMFMSGAVKWLSADITWWNLSALTVHYETQPLPTWIGWHAHQLPAAWHQFSCAILFVIELVVPAFIFGGRQFRQIACGAFASLMLIISLTGNYCFFNLLTAALCLLLLDDAMLRRFLPQRMKAAFSPPITAPLRARHRLVLLGMLAAGILFLSGTQTLARFIPREWIPNAVYRCWQWASPFRSVNSYGLFAVMTTTRPEIVVEGSRDGVHWQAYEFKWKPGDLQERPRFAAPHQPRLDWQMWFAALGHYQNNPWFMNFLARLLQGSPEVLALLKENPFPDRPPERIRALLYQYRFTDVETRAATGQWWQRELQGVYCPEIVLNQRVRE